MEVIHLRAHPARSIDTYKHRKPEEKKKRSQGKRGRTPEAEHRAAEPKKKRLGGLGLESPAEAEPVAPRPRLVPEPAVPAPGRRRGGAAQHLPHHVHVLVLARAHLLPQPPQPCTPSKSDRRRRSQTNPSILRAAEGVVSKPARAAAAGLTCLANPEAGRDAEPGPPHRQHDAVPPVPHRRMDGSIDRRLADDAKPASRRAAAGPAPQETGQDQAR